MSTVAKLNRLPLPTQAKRLLRKIFVDASPTYAEAVKTCDREPGLFSGSDRRALARLASGTAENKAFEINNTSFSTNVKKWLTESAP